MEQRSWLLRPAAAMPACLARWGRAALGLLYPKRCPFCDEVLGQLAACPDCEAAERALRRSVPRLAGDEHLLAGLAGGAAAYRYEGAVRQAVLRMKSGARACYGPQLGAAMAEQLFGCRRKDGEWPAAAGTRPPAALEYDCVIPVPSSGRRPYNPPGLLAKELAAALGLPLAADALYKTHQTPQQKSLDRAGRLCSLTGAFAVRPGRLAENSRVLLVDDVVTTGATLTACAAALHKAGAAEVFAVCLAATPPPAPAP